MLGLRLTVNPFARSACAYISPMMNSSVKFLSPIVIGGLPLPGCPPAAAEDEPDPDPADELDEDEDEELPQAANAATAKTTPTPVHARFKTDCISSPRRRRSYPARFDAD